MLRVFAALLLAPGLAVCADQYQKLLKKQGFIVFEHPTTEFGTGTITTKVPGDKLQIHVAAAKECFPGLEGKLVKDRVKLLDSVRLSNLKLDVGAKYLPGPLMAITGAFGFDRAKNMDVTFGDSEAPTLTVEGMMSMVEGSSVSKRCIGYLSDRNNTVLLSAVRVNNMKYAFKGGKKVGVSADASLLAKALTLTPNLKWETSANDTLTISNPMYIAGKPVHFVNLGLFIQEGSEGTVTLTKGKFRLE